MKKVVLTLSSLLMFNLSGCSVNPAHPGDESSLAQDGEGESARTDWLTAWWKKSVPEPVQRGVRGLGFNRWFAATPPPEHDENTDQPENHASLWDTLGDKLTLVDPSHPRIQKEANFYARNPRFLDHMSEHAEPYINFVLGEVQRRNMPVEVALLPAIESAYEPRATSPRQAAGLWQLIPGTARRWGLDLNQHYDGRRDVFASTNAALNYLQKLNDDFGGDWLLTMAAYNCGELNVAHAIERNIAHGRPTDFWSLDLPAETRTFVPRILGLAALVAEPQNYGVQLKTLRDMPVTPVKVDYQVDLARVALIADVPLKEVQRLNPAYRNGKTDSDGGNLLLPARQAQAFEERLAAIDPKELSPFPTVSDVSLPEAAAEVVERASERSIAERPVVERAATHPSPPKVHVVRRGDTLGSLAHAAGVEVKEIMAWNHLKPRANLRPGQRLTLSMGKTPVTLAKSHHSADKHTSRHGNVKATVLAHGGHHTKAQHQEAHHHSASKLASNQHTSRTNRKRS
ncbi:membrane-bound lytic murein transglycosylase D [Gammaproteobacteria bacterium]